MLRKIVAENLQLIAIIMLVQKVDHQLNHAVRILQIRVVADIVVEHI